MEKGRPVAVTLRITDSNQLLPETETQRVLSEGTLTLGRDDDNDWVLPDPSQVISGKHCTIEAVNGRYFLHDTSSNGTRLNADHDPIGRGNSVPIQHGDTIQIFQFEIQVLMEEEAAALPEDFLTPASDTASPEETTGAPQKWRFNSAISTLDELLNSTKESAEPRLSDSRPADLPSEIPLDTDPFQEPAAQEFIPLDADLSAAPSENDFFDPPQPLAEIPDNWDLEPGVAESAPPPPVKPPKKPAPKPAKKPAATQQTPQAAKPTPPPVRAAQTALPREMPASAMGPFLEGAGLRHLNLTAKQIPPTQKVLGAVFREVVKGLMGLLKARSKLKNEFRLKQTIIGPSENNPLQFAPTVEDAMENLLIKKGTGYLPPIQAVKKSFEDIKAHEVAILTGMQRSLRKSLEHFDPKKIVREVDAKTGLAQNLVPKKIQYWDEFETQYQKMIHDLENEFNNLYLREFAQSYEEQIEKQKNR